MEAYANSYIGKIQQRLDVELNGDQPLSLEYQLRDSNFTTWVETIDTEIVDNCVVIPNEPHCFHGCCTDTCYINGNGPPGPPCGNGASNPCNSCKTTDGYRYDLVIGDLHYGCTFDVPVWPDCDIYSSCVPLDERCPELDESARKYAQDTIDDMFADIAEAENLQRLFIDALNYISANPASDEMCGPLSA